MGDNMSIIATDEQSSEAVCTCPGQGSVWPHRHRTLCVGFYAPNRMLSAQSVPCPCGSGRTHHDCVGIDHD